MSFLIVIALSILLSAGIAEIPAVGPGCLPPVKNPQVIGKCAE